jgi:hypothetical protein
MEITLRRLRGAAGTALAWAVTWFGAGLLFITTVNVFRLGVFRQYADFSLAIALGWSARVAAVGFITGGIFSLYVATALGGRRLEELKPARFALAGTLVAVLVSFAWYAGWSVFYSLPLKNLLWPVLVPAVFGGVASYGSIALAQRALPKGMALPGRDGSHRLPP